MTRGTLRELLQAWNASRLSTYTLDERREWCMQLIDNAYEEIVKPHRPRQPVETFTFALTLFQATERTSVTTIRQRYKQRALVMEKFVSVLMQEEVGVLASKEYGYATPTQRLAYARVNNIRCALRNFCEMAVGVATTFRMSNTPHIDATEPLSVEELDDPSPYNRLVEWMATQCLRMGLKRTEDGLVEGVYTSLGLATGCVQRLCDFDEFVPRFLPMENPKLFIEWQNHVSKFDVLARRWLKDAVTPQLPDVKYNFSTRAYENGIFNCSTLECSYFTLDDWNPEALAGYTEADTEERAVIRAELEAEVDKFKEHTSGMDSIQVAGINTFTEKCRAAERNAAMSSTDRFLNSAVDAASSQPLKFYKGMYLPAGAILAPTLADLAAMAPTWSSIYAKQGYTEDEMLIVNGLCGRSMFDVSSKGGGDGWQIAVCLNGPPGNGKGASASALSALYNPDQIATLSNHMEKKFGGQTWANARLMILAEMGNDFPKNFDMKELMTFVSGDDGVSLRVKNGKVVIVNPWPAQLFMCSNETGLTGRGWNRRLVIIDMPNEVKEEDVDPELPHKLAAEMPVLMVLWARAYHQLREKVRIKGGGLKANLPARFLRGIKKFNVRLNTLEIYLTQSSQVMLHRDVPRDPLADYYMSWDDLKIAFNTWVKTCNGTPMNMTDETIFMPVLHSLGISLVTDTRPDPFTQFDRRTKWAVGVKSLLVPNRM